MKKIFPIFLLVIHSTISYAAQIQADVTKTRQLENALLCEKPLSPKKIYNLVSELNGTNPQNRSDSFRGIYTVPFGFYILNQQNLILQDFWQMMRDIPTVTPHRYPTSLLQKPHHC